MKTKLHEWQKKAKDSDSECIKCGRSYYLTVDHILPEHFLYSLNLIDEVNNWEENFELICGACNKLKGGMIEIKNPKTIPLIEEALRRCKAQIT